MSHQWPNNARCVVLLTVDCDGTGNEVGQGRAPDGAASVGGYAQRRGIPRLLDIFHHHAVPATFFTVGYDAVQQPEIVRRIVAEGHEVAAHGYLHESWLLDEVEEEALLRKTHGILTGITGVAPLGWRSPGGHKTAGTLAVLRELGYIYDSSDKDFDRPYPAVVRGEPSTRMIEIPNMTSTLDDAYMYGIGAMTPAEILDVFTSEFDALYHGLGYFILTCHARAGRGSGLPARARVIERLIMHIQRYPDVHFSRMDDLARWCLDPTHGFIDLAVPLGGRA
jgi:peptidoglycan/xylan/chitin deacetylase (PgdA/CDA1 family)